MLQQAIGGVEGEIRVRPSVFLPGVGHPGSAEVSRDADLDRNRRDQHLAMLSTAVALNLEGTPPALQEEAAQQDPAVAAILGGMSPRHYLSAGLAASPTNSEGVPFDTSHVYASGNIAADMYSNVTAEATGRVLATRLHHMTDDPGMKDMLAFLIARDTMHQQQWLAVIAELGGYEGVLPIPNSFPQDQENQDVNYVYVDTRIGEDAPPLEGRFTSGPSLDGKGEYSIEKAEPMGDKPRLAPPDPSTFPETQQLEGDAPATPAS